VRRPIAFEISEVRRRDKEMDEWGVVSHRRGEEKKSEWAPDDDGYIYVSGEKPDFVEC